VPVRPPSNSCASVLRQRGDDAGHDDQRHAVADAAAGDLLADPHQEQGAADQADRAATRNSMPGSTTAAMPWLAPRLGFEPRRR
jgi:hypothetical protein